MSGFELWLPEWKEVVVPLGQANEVKIGYLLQMTKYK